MGACCGAAAHYVACMWVCLHARACFFVCCFCQLMSRSVRPLSCSVLPLSTLLAPLPCSLLSLFVWLLILAVFVCFFFSFFPSYPFSLCVMLSCCGSLLYVVFFAAGCSLSGLVFVSFFFCFSHFLSFLSSRSVLSLSLFFSPSASAIGIDNRLRTRNALTHALKVLSVFYMDWDSCQDRSSLGSFALVILALNFEWTL